MIPLILAALALTALGLIPLQLHVDTRHSWTVETDRWHSPELSALPAPRRNLTGAWPVPQTAMDLPARWDTESSWLRLVQRPLVVELHIGGGKHRFGEAPGTDTRRLRWNSPTGQFWAIVEFNEALDEPCSHCAAPEDGERAHAGCPGCACPCSAVEPMPEGVDGYAIAGRTR